MDTARALFLVICLVICLVIAGPVHADPDFATPAVLEPFVVDEAFHVPDAQLARLITILLDQNPGIKAARATWRAGLERVPQQASLPDPRLSYRYFVSTPETRVGPQEHALELTQAFPGRGKRGEQARRAGLEASAVAWQVRELERSLVADLKHQYFEAAYLQEALIVNLEETALLRRFEQTALTRYSTGVGTQQNVIKVQTDISRLADRETLLVERLRVVSLRIGALIGEPETEATLLPIPLELVEIDDDVALLEDEAMPDHPGIRAAEHGIEASEAGVQRRKLDSKPDFRVGVSWAIVGDRDDPAAALSPPEDNGQDVWAVSVGLSLPVHRRRIRAGVAEAQELLRSEQYGLERTRDGLRRSIREAALRRDSIEHRARLYQEVIIPQAEQSLHSAEAAYSTNRQDFLDLLDAQRVLFQARLTYYRLLADHWIAIADLEFGLGRAFPGRGDRQ